MRSPPPILLLTRPRRCCSGWRGGRSPRRSGHPAQPPWFLPPAALPDPRGDRAGLHGMRPALGDGRDECLRCLRPQPAAPRGAPGPALGERGSRGEFRPLLRKGRPRGCLLCTAGGRAAGRRGSPAAARPPGGGAVCAAERPARLGAGGAAGGRPADPGSCPAQSGGPGAGCGGKIHPPAQHSGGAGERGRPADRKRPLLCGRRSALGRGNARRGGPGRPGGCGAPAAV